MESEIIFIDPDNARLVDQQRVKLRIRAWPWLLAALLAFTIAVLQGRSALDFWADWYRIGADGIAIPAEYVRHQQNNDDTCDLTYQYQVGDQEVSATRQVEQSICEEAEQFGIVDILYLPDSPVRSEVATNAPTTGTAARLTTLAVASISAGMILGFIGLRRVYAWVRLGRGAQIMPGDIVRVNQTQDENGAVIVDVVYVVVSPNSERILEGKARYSLGSRPLPRTGQRVVVAYANDRTFQAL